LKKIIILMTVGSLIAMGTAVAPAPDEVTLQGEYVWNNDPGEPGNLQAVFKPKSEKDQWDVDFHFRFSGQDHVYSGTAEGSLENGVLKGTVQNERRNRTFFFEGNSANGNFTGNHSEKNRGTTGTLSLSKQ